MHHIIAVIILIIVSYFTGYAMGRKDIVEDIKEITKKLSDNDNSDLTE